jgi:hypothetical protein
MAEMIQIFAIDESGHRQEITDLYFFEEEGIHNWDGETLYGEKYTFEIFIGNIKVFPQ